MVSNKSRIDMTMTELALHNGGRDIDDPLSAELERRERLIEKYGFVPVSMDETMPEFVASERKGMKDE